MNTVDIALQALGTRTKTYPHVVVTRAKLDRVFKDIVKQEVGFTDEYLEWLQVNDLRFYEDIFLVLFDEQAFVYFRNNDIGSQFKLKFL